MASQNKRLGSFFLKGIRRAPRGVPQIEVTFSIDTNGIVNVSAKDLDTGKRQEITIQGSGNMSREEIDKAIRDAQMYAKDDEKIREDSQAKKRLENLLFRAENEKKQLPKEQKKAVDEIIKRGTKALKKNDMDAIKQCISELESALNISSDSI